MDTHLILFCVAMICQKLLKVEDVNLSDHFLISFTANCTAAKTEYKTSTCRNIKSIDIEKFKADVLNSLTGSNFTSFGDKISFYNDNLKRLLDSYAPLKTKSVKIVPHAPWFDLESTASLGSVDAKPQESI